MLKKFVTILTVLLIIVLTCIPAFSFNYPNSYQLIIDDLGYDTEPVGYYVFGHCAYGDCLILIPANYKDYIAVTPNCELYNVGSSTIRGQCFVGNTSTRRDYYINSYDYVQYNYRTQNGVTQYRDIALDEIYDTNIEFDSGVPNEFNNSSVYWSKFEKAVIISLVTIIFLLFLGWFLLHRH